MSFMEEHGTTLICVIIFMMRKNKAQTALVYAALIAFVAITLIAMFGYIQQKVQGVYKQAGDSIGEGEISD